MRTVNKQITGTYAGCLIRINGAMESFKPSLRLVAEFAIANPERVMHMSISEASQNIGVGESTIIRFCRALGY
ncbi:MAG TPA: hypothetical protein VNA17_09780, partial [Pyrinomonadaceae bacterium]|nr:hypothetical protein [Pyrinomonadaceae bacterium]